MTTREQVKLLATGKPEFDEKLAGGIPSRSLVLLEGEADAGKSLLVQHFTHKALTSGLAVAYYITGNTVKDLMGQMTSLDLDVTDYFLCDRLRVYPLGPTTGLDSGAAFSSLIAHFESLPINLKVIIVDALTPLMAQSDQRHIIDFFAACKQLSDLGRAIVAVVHSNAGDADLLERVRSICDTHLSLRIEQQDDQQVRVMEVLKVSDAAQPEDSILAFSIGPGEGIKVVPLTSPRA